LALLGCGLISIVCCEAVFAQASSYPVANHAPETAPATNKSSAGTSAGSAGGIAETYRKIGEDFAKTITTPPDEPTSNESDTSQVQPLNISRSTVSPNNREKSAGKPIQKLSPEESDRREVNQIIDSAVTEKLKVPGTDQIDRIIEDSGSDTNTATQDAAASREKTDTEPLTIGTKPLGPDQIAKGEDFLKPRSIPEEPTPKSKQKAKPTETEYRGGDLTDEEFGKEVLKSRNFPKLGRDSVKKLQDRLDTLDRQ
jgi:hypothetical protein